MPHKPETLTTVEENTHRQRRWGCTCGCLTTLTALIFGTLAFFYFALKPHPLAKADRWLNSDTVGFGVLRFSSADPGVADFFTFLAGRLEQRWGQELKENERRALHSALLIARQSPDWMVYPPVYFYLERTPQSSVHQSAVVIAQFRHFFGYLLCRSTLVSLGLIPEQGAAGELIFRLGAREGAKRAPVLNVTQQFLVFSSTGQLPAMVEATTSPLYSSTPGDRFLTLYGELNTDRPEPGEDLGLVIANEGDTLASFLKNLFDALGQQRAWDQIQEMLAGQGVTFSEISGVRLSVDLVTADRMKCVATVYVYQAAALRKLSEVAKLLEGYSTPQGSSGLSLRITARPGRNEVTVTLEMTGLRDVVSALISAAPSAGKPAAPSTPTTNSGASRP
jgi:hypothetical protein